MGLEAPDEDDDPGSLFNLEGYQTVKNLINKQLIWSFITNSLLIYFFV